MKSYTDIEQSKKLAEILPVESADMFLALDGTLPVMSKYIDDGFVTADNTAIPCWSLAALLEVLNMPALTQNNDDDWDVVIIDPKYPDEYIEVHEPNPVDVCVEMIYKLKENNLL